MIRCAGESPLTPKLDHLPHDTTVERDVFSFWCVLPESIWSDITASFLEGFSGITVVYGVRLASSEKRGAATKEIQPSASGTAARMKSAPERSPLMNKSLLFQYWWYVDVA